MRKLYTLVMLLLAGFISKTNAQDIQWGKGFNPPNSGDDKDIYIESHCTDLNGNIYTTGYFSEDIDFNIGGTPYVVTAQQNSEGFIAKYDKNGNVKFVQRLKGSFAFVFSIITDNKGSLYITGSLANDTYFDPDGANFPLTRGGFIAKYDTSGNFIYAKKLGYWGRNLYADNEQNIYICGFYEEGNDMDPGEEVLHLPAYGERDVFFAKFTPSGDLVFAKGIGGPGNDMGGNNYDCNIAANSSGEIILSGSISASDVDFDPGEGTSIITQYSQTGYIAHYSSTGELIKAGAVRNSNNYIHDMYVDANDNIFITGELNGTVNFNFDPNNNTWITSAGMQDIYFAKYDSELNLLFAKKMGGTNTDRGFGIEVDALGYINVVGDFYKSADMDPSSVVKNYGTGNNTYHLFLAKYNAEGNLVKVNYLVGNLNPSPFTISSTGDICLSGRLQSTADFDFGDGTYTLEKNSTGSSYLVKYKQSPELKLWYNGRIEEDTEIDAGTADVGTSLEAKEFFIRNTGAWKLDFTENPGITLSGIALADYSIDQSLIGTSLLMGDSVKFTVTFTPSEGGEREAQLTIHNNTPQASAFSIHLKGTGIPPATSIADAFDNRIVLYPNPSTDGYITIESPEKLTEITVSNTIGQKEVFHTASFTTSLKGILTVLIKTTSNVYVDRICIK